MDTGETGASGSSRKGLIILGVHTQSLRCHVNKPSCWSWRSTSVCVFSQRTRWTKATSAHWRKEKEEREKKREEGAKEEGGEDLPKTSCSFLRPNKRYQERIFQTIVDVAGPFTKVPSIRDGWYKYWLSPTMHWLAFIQQAWLSAYYVLGSRALAVHQTDKVLALTESTWWCSESSARTLEQEWPPACILTVWPWVCFPMKRE